jgi:hypothetical protein
VTTTFAFITINMPCNGLPFDALVHDSSRARSEAPLSSLPGAARSLHHRNSPQPRRPPHSPPPPALAPLLPPHLRGGSSGIATDDEDVCSPFASPELTKVRAFAPRAAPRGRPGLVRSWSQELKHDTSADWLGLARARIGGDLAWFYPDPPWGRKDVCCPGSRALTYWNMVVWAAMTYVAAAVPFLAAGFTSAYTDVRQASPRPPSRRRRPAARARARAARVTLDA